VRIADICRGGPQGRAVSCSVAVPSGSICQTATNLDIATLNVSLPGISKENYATGRVDQKISDKDNLSASYFFDSGPLTQPDPLLNATHSVFSRRQMASARRRIFSIRSWSIRFGWGSAACEGILTCQFRVTQLRPTALSPWPLARRLHRRLEGLALRPQLFGRT